MKKLFAIAILFLLPPFALCAAQPDPQSSPSPEKIQSQAELEKVITALDAALFDAYNHCDLKKFASLIDDNVEFYHDQGGLTLGQAALTDSVKKNICGKVTRELVPGSLKARFHERIRRSRAGRSPLPPPRPRSHRGGGEGQFIQRCP